MSKLKTPVEEETGDEIEPEEEEQYEEEPDTASYFQTPFTEEQLQNVHRLRSTPYKEESKYVITETKLSPRAKKAMFGFIDQFLSEMSLLANYPSREKALLNYDIAEIAMKHAYYQSDLKNPILFHILGLIRTHFDSILTRAYGPDRERIINGRQTQEHRTVSTQDQPIRVKAQNKRKGLLGF